MRVSERQRYHIATNRIERTKNQNAHALDVLSSQKKVNNLRDDPIGFSRVVRVKDHIQELEQFQKNVRFTQGFLDVSETAIGTINEKLGRAQELALAMANDSYGPDSRESTSKEIKELVNQVIQLANSKYNSRYVFSGFRSRYPAVSQEGLYLGDDGQIFLQTGKDAFSKINISGRFLFEATNDERKEGHFNMIDALDILREGMELSDKDSIYKAIDELNFQMNKAATYQASVGALSTSLEQALDRLDVTKEKSIEELSTLEDADIYKATSDFKRTEAVLQSTLMASNKLLQPSLLNFMS